MGDVDAGKYFYANQQSYGKQLENVILTSWLKSFADIPMIRQLRILVQRLITINIDQLRDKMQCHKHLLVLTSLELLEEDLHQNPRWLHYY